MKVIFTIPVLLLALSASGQTIDRSVIGSAGTLMVSSGHNLNFTIGESVVGFVKDDYSVHQGFWGKKGILVIPLGVGNEDNVEIVVYPNPVMDELTIFSGDSEVLAMQVFSVNSQRVFMKSVEDDRVEHVIDMRSMAKGVYILQLLLKGTVGLKEYKIIKN